MAFSHEDVEKLANEAGLSARTKKKLHDARVRLARPASEATAPAARGHGAAAADRTPLVNI